MLEVGVEKTIEEGGFKLLSHDQKLRYRVIEGFVEKLKCDSTSKG